MNPAKPNTPKVAIIVPRVSTGAQAEKGTSLEAQELACLRKAADLGAAIHAVYRDPGVSGTLYAAREGIQAALTDIEAGRANVLITYRLDRAGRDVDILRDIKRRVEKAGAEMVFADGLSFERNAMGDLMFTQLAAIAAFEPALIRERTMSGRRNKAEKGQQPARAMTPYGYRVVTHLDVAKGEHSPDQTGQYVVVETEAATVREVFTRYGAGVSLQQIARWLNDAGVPTRRGGKSWTSATIRNFIKHPVYKGQAVYGRYQRLTDESRLLRYDDRFLRSLTTPHYYVERPEDEWVVIPAPPLVSEELWDECNQRLANNRTVMSGNPARKHFLSGILRCPVCGHLMHGVRIGKKRVLYYRCKNAYGERDATSTGCTGRQYPAAEAERAMVEALVYAANHPEHMESAMAAYVARSRSRQPRTSVVEAEAMREELERLEQEERATVQAQIEGIKAGANPAIYAELFADLCRRRNALEERLAASERTEKVAIPIRKPRKLADAYSVVTSAVEKALRSPLYTPAERRALVMPVVEFMVPIETGYDIFLRDPQSSPGTPSPYGIQTLLTVRGQEFGAEVREASAAWGSVGSSELAVSTAR